MGVGMIYRATVKAPKVTWDNATTFEKKSKIALAQAIEDEMFIARGANRKATVSIIINKFDGIWGNRLTFQVTGNAAEIRRTAENMMRGW